MTPFLFLSYLANSRAFGPSALAASAGEQVTTMSPTPIASGETSFIFFAFFNKVPAHDQREPLPFNSTLPAFPDSLKFAARPPGKCTQIVPIRLRSAI